MPRIIYKYVMPANASRSQFQVPSGARVLSVQLQHGLVTIWMLHRKPERGIEWIFKTFRIVCTGFAQVGENDEYLATVQAPPDVWHVFEE